MKMFDEIARQVEEAGFTTFANNSSVAWLESNWLSSKKIYKKSMRVAEKLKLHLRISLDSAVATVSGDFVILWTDAEIWTDAVEQKIQLVHDRREVTKEEAGDPCFFKAHLARVLKDVCTTLTEAASSVSVAAFTGDF